MAPEPVTADHAAAAPTQAQPAAADAPRRPAPEEPTLVHPAPAGTAASAGSAAPAAEPGAKTGQRLSIAAHPQATRMVRRARDAAGLAGFLVAGWTALPTHTLAGTLLSAIAAGLACRIVVWAAAVLLARYLIVAELRNRELALLNAARARAQATAHSERQAAGGSA